MGDSFLGVQLPDNFGSSSAADTGSAPEAIEQSISKDGNNTETTAQSVKDMLDLDKLDRFRFQGKEWTAKDLRNAYMMKQDYTRKTQELSETRKYANNFEADLDAVLEDPNLLDKMRAVYPASYVKVAERALAKLNPEPSTSPTSSPSVNQTQLTPEVQRLMKEFSEMKNTLSGYEREKYQAEIAKNEAWLDKTYSNLGKKYPYANEEVVTARAAYMREQGHDITEKALESIFRHVNKDFQERYAKNTQVKQSEQLNNNLRAKDTGAGGGIPGSPAVTPKDFKSAKAAALDHFTRPR